MSRLPCWVEKKVDWRENAVVLLSHTATFLCRQVLMKFTLLQISFIYGCPA